MKNSSAIALRPGASSAAEQKNQAGVVCLYDGVRRRNLKGYLRAKYGVTERAYREEFGLPEDAPLAASRGRPAPVWNRA